MSDNKSQQGAGGALTLAGLEERINVIGRAVLGSENFGKLMHTAVSTRTSFEQAFSKQMEKNLHFYNMPSQADLVELGAQCNRIEERVVRIEMMLSRIVDRLEPEAAPKTPAVPRTRQPRKRAAAAKGSKTASKASKADS